MAKSRTKQKPRSGRRRRDWRQTVFLVISVLIVLSMALALVGTCASPPV